MCDTKKDKGAWETSRQGDLYSKNFKPITMALRQVTTKGNACTIERVERSDSVM